MNGIGINEEYGEFTIPKRSGGVRVINAPNPELKEEQRRILKILEKEVRPSPFAHGFVKYRNIVTNSLPHVGKDIVISCDIKDFFSNVTRYGYEGYLFDHSNDISNKSDSFKDGTILLIKNKCFYQSTEGKWVLPQGAPTSPYLANLFLKGFDWRLARFIRKHYKNADYTRYADNITVSANDPHLYTVISVIKSYLVGLRLELNEDKTRVMRKYNRQIVCGIVVNVKINLPRKYRKLLRAMKHRDNQTEQAKGHYSFENEVYNIEYNNMRYRTKDILERHGVIKTLISM